jgi:hypothetical protein
LTDGIKVGMVVRLTAGSFNALNLNKNILVTAVTATVVTGTPLNGFTLFAEGPIASATMTVPGKVTYAPTTGHTQVYYTFEEWYSDVPASEVSSDVKVGSVSLSLPGTGNATIDFSLNGLVQTRATSVYFAAPTAETTSSVLVAASGALFVNGVSQAIVTDINMEISGNLTPADGTVGSNTRPDIFDGKVMATGTFTAYFDSNTIPDMFLNETEVSLLSALTAGSTANAEFNTIFIPRLKINTDTLDDGETGLKRTYQFEALYNANGGAALATQQTSVQIHDSLEP